MSEGKPLVKEESMQGMQEGKLNYVRVRVLVRDLTAKKLVN
jgi:hypothetical protein